MARVKFPSGKPREISTVYIHIYICTQRVWLLPKRRHTYCFVSGRSRISKARPQIYPRGGILPRGWHISSERVDPFIRLIFMAYFYFLPRKKWWKGEARDLTSRDRRNVDKVRGGSSRWESGLVATFVWNAFDGTRRKYGWARSGGARWKSWKTTGCNYRV